MRGDWSGRRAQAALHKIRQQGYADSTPCHICKQPIDYRLPASHPDGCTVQHIKPRSIFPHLTWDETNWAPAHRLCNQAEGNRYSIETEDGNLGVTSRDWG